MTALLTLDVGTHSVRAAVFEHGRCLDIRQRPLTLERRPQADGSVWIEQDGRAIVTGLKTCIRELAEGLGSVTNPLSATALACQRSTVIAWDCDTGETLGPAISWQDTRGYNQVAALAPHGPAIEAITGLRLSAHYGASKLHWLEHTLSSERQVFGPLAAFLLHHLLRDHPFVCDQVNASRTQLWNLRENRWDRRCCDWFQVPVERLPQIKPCLSDFGTLSDVGILAHWEARSDNGALAGQHPPTINVPLKLVTGDQNAALLAIDDKLRRRAILVNAGTGGFVLTELQSLPRDASPYLLSPLISSTSERRFVAEGTVNGCAAALTWLRDLCPECADPGQLLTGFESARSVPVFINGIGGLGSPFWQPAFPILFVDGEGQSANPEEARQRWPAAELAAAVVESIAFLVAINAEGLQAVRKRSGMAGADQLLISGGISQLAYFRRALVSVCGLPVSALDDHESTLLGLARTLAGDPQPTQTQPLTELPEAAIQQRYQRFRQHLEAYLGH